MNSASGRDCSRAKTPIVPSGLLIRSSKLHPVTGMGREVVQGTQGQD